MKDFVLLVLVLSFFLSCDSTYGKYVKVSNCKVNAGCLNCIALYFLSLAQNASESCSYQYHARMELGKGEQVSISAKVDISCESGQQHSSIKSTQGLERVRLRTLITSHIGS